MKSLLLAALLALSGSFFMNGCSVEDTVKDIVENEIKPNVIYVVNGTAGGITVSVTGEETRYLASKNLKAQAYTLTESSKYTVSYDNGAHAKAFSYGSTYLYAATTCNTKGYVDDKVDRNRVHVVNLTGETFTDNVQVIDAKGAAYTITDNAGACGVTTSNQLDKVVVGNGMRVKIGNGNWETITGIPSEVVGLANSVKVDVIIYSTSTGTIVPMAGYEDLK
jgi:hypothetical protein